MRRYTAHFDPQTWVNDNAVPVHSQGPQEWDCTAYLAEVEAKMWVSYQEIEQDITRHGRWLDCDDVLRDDPAAPQWVHEWDGPFTITVRHQEIPQYE